MCQSSNYFVATKIQQSLNLSSTQSTLVSNFLNQSSRVVNPQRRLRQKRKNFPNSSKSLKWDLSTQSVSLNLLALFVGDLSNISTKAMITSMSVKCVRQIVNIETNSLPIKKLFVIC